MFDEPEVFECEHDCGFEHPDIGVVEAHERECTFVKREPEEVALAAAAADEAEERRLERKRQRERTDDYERRYTSGGRVDRLREPSAGSLATAGGGRHCGPHFPNAAGKLERVALVINGERTVVHARGEHELDDEADAPAAQRQRLAEETVEAEGEDGDEMLIYESAAPI